MHTFRGDFFFQTVFDIFVYFCKIARALERTFLLAKLHWDHVFAFLQRNIITLKVGRSLTVVLDKRRISLYN